MSLRSSLGSLGSPFGGCGWGRRCASTLGSLAPSEGATRQQNRVGRGPGSGRGKTAGRGTKGQKARHGVHPWFEGGQTPITKLFPKVGFRSQIARPAEINLGTIQRLIDEQRLDAAQPITMRELYKSRALGGQALHGVKILGRGAGLLKQPITLSASLATAHAIERVEQLGGKFTAEYYTRLGMRALTRPEATLRKHARVPLRARPVSRRAIEFYRDEARRGALAGTPGAPEVKSLQRSERTTVSPLVKKLEELEAADPSAAGARTAFL